MTSNAFWVPLVPLWCPTSVGDLHYHVDSNRLPKMATVWDVGIATIFAREVIARCRPAPLPLPRPPPSALERTRAEARSCLFQIL